MREGIVIAVLYVLFLGLFRLVGGFAAAAETFWRWGRASSTVLTRASSSS